MPASTRAQRRPAVASLAFYGHLDRLPWPTSFSGKIFLIAFLTTHIPLLALIAYLVARQGAVSPVAVLLVAFLATLAGAALSLYALHQLLRPLLLADRALDAYLEAGEIVDLPTDYRDSCGRLLRNIARTITTFERQRRRLEEQASRDALTGLLNRHGAAARIDEGARRAARAGRPLCLALVDVDHFKAINDRHGHAGGDAVLTALGHELRGAVRADDWVARWGGEEFLLVLEASLPGAVTALEALRARVAARPLPVDDETISITISAGVALLDHPGAVGRCLRAADAALYSAKRAGRNRVVAASGEDGGDRDDAAPPGGAGGRVRPW